jgi:hypothetical protein
MSLASNYCNSKSDIRGEVLSDNCLDILKHYRVYIDAPARFKLYALEPYKLLDSPAAWNEILECCDNIQMSVWNAEKKYSEVIANRDILIFITCDDLGVGFVSARLLPIESEEYKIICYTEAMFQTNIQGTKLLRIALESVRSFYRLADSNHQLCHVVASGQISCFKYFLSIPSILAINPGLEQHNRLWNKTFAIASSEFLRSELTSEGIVKAAWHKQNLTTSNPWPNQIAQNLGLPPIVDYRSGDVLVRFFTEKS